MANLNTWLVTRLLYDEESGMLSLAVQSHNPQYKDANFLLSIIGELGNVASWTPDYDVIGCGGILRVYPHTEHLAKIFSFVNQEDIIGTLSKVSYWLNTELQKRREQYKEL